MKIFAPAKINLNLYITARRSDGYHTLNSYVTFADVGDVVEITPNDQLRFEITGQFAKSFNGLDRFENNLVVRAALGLTKLVNKQPNVKIMLEKNLPLGAGLGGGSADAAAVVWGLLRYWDIAVRDVERLDAFLLSLGADIPVCFASCDAHVRGIGDVIGNAPLLPEIPIVLIHPNKHCDTARIFSAITQYNPDPPPLPRYFEDRDACFDYLMRGENMMQHAAIALIPEIQSALNALQAHMGCRFVRMSGSGSACFGIFEDEQTAQIAAHDLAQHNPDWWVKSAWLGRTERY